ncbi:MAG: PEGA domain-containing protein [Spirochaetales bacterium]|jgi:hypothetical protein|nr:PEGA domain-containing protein [Spirochaetales bacterium]
MRKLAAGLRLFCALPALICAAALPVSGEDEGPRESVQPPRRVFPIEDSVNAPGAEITSDTDFELESRVRPAKPGDPVPSPELIVESLPAGAEVLINNTYAGMTPFSLRTLNPGGYRVLIRKAQYKPASVFLTLEPGKTFYLRARLLKNTGTLKVSALPHDAEVYAGTQRLLSRQTELPVGVYDILVRRFGYEEYKTSVRISENADTNLEAVLTASPFTVSGFSVSRGRLNPENPGLLGKTEFSFAVSAPGTARLSIRDSGGNEVFSHEFAPFTTWNQNFLWNGGSAAGGQLPGGIYRAVLICKPENGRPLAPEEIEIEINRGLVIRYKNTWHGLSGLMYAPTASVLPPWSFQINSNIMGLAAAPGRTEWSNLYLFQLGGAAGIPGGLEIIPALSLGAKSGEGGWPDISGSLGLKYRFFRAGGFPSLSLAATARGMAAAEPSYGGFSQFPGLAAGLAAEIRLGSLGITTAPEFQASPYRLGRETSMEEVSGHYWTTLRFGLFYDAGFLSAGLSSALALSLYPESPKPRRPLYTGFEVHTLLPNSFLNLSGFVSWEHSADTEETGRLFVGGGIGIVY